MPEYPKPPKREKKAPKPLKRTAIKPKKKQTGEAALFKQIWEERPHTCTNCKEWLGDDACAQFFSHIIPKSRGEKYRLDPDNIELLCFDCHYMWEHDKDEFKNRKR